MNFIDGVNGNWVSIFSFIILYLLDSSNFILNNTAFKFNFLYFFFFIYNL